MSGRKISREMKMKKNIAHYAIISIAMTGLVACGGDIDRAEFEGERILTTANGPIPAGFRPMRLIIWPCLV
jgi:hypothetical protein